jgi:hypothetical protein
VVGDRALFFRRINQERQPQRRRGFGTHRISLATFPLLAIAGKAFNLEDGKVLRRESLNERRTIFPNM